MSRVSVKVFCDEQELALQTGSLTRRNRPVEGVREFAPLFGRLFGEKSHEAGMCFAFPFLDLLQLRVGEFRILANHRCQQTQSS